MIPRHEMLHRRATQTEATNRAWSFVPVVLGTADCALMLRSHVRRFGHKASLMRWGRYSTEAGIRKALDKRGCATVADGMDLYGFTRIGAASALPGDAVAVRSDNGIGAFGILLGRGNVLMSKGDLIQPCRVKPELFDALLGCWRIELVGEPVDG